MRPFTVWVDCFSDRKKLLKFEAEGWKFTKTIYSNSESLEQFLAAEWFFDLFLAVSNISNKLEQLEFILDKNCDLETGRKS